MFCLSRMPHVRYYCRCKECRSLFVSCNGCRLNASQYLKRVKIPVLCSDKMFSTLAIRTNLSVGKFQRFSIIAIQRRGDPQHDDSRFIYVDRSFTVKEPCANVESETEDTENDSPWSWCSGPLGGQGGGTNDTRRSSLFFRGAS